MVEVIIPKYPHGGSAGPTSQGGTGAKSLIHIHNVRREVHGNGVVIKVYGEMKLHAGQYVYAREMKLNTLQVLLLTPELNLNNGLGYMAQKLSLIHI